MASRVPADSAVESRAKRFKSAYKHYFVTIKVGAEANEENFVVHRDALCSRSTFFEAACSDRWTETTDKIVPLPLHLPEIFRVYLDWMHGEQDICGSLNQIAQTYADRANIDTAHEKSQAVRPSMCILTISANAWALGDFIGDAEYTNAVMDALHRSISRDYMTTEQVAKVFAIAPESCALQRYIVDYIADKLPETNEAWLDGIPHTAHTLILKEYLRRQNSKRELISDRFKEGQYYVRRPENEQIS